MKGTFADRKVAIYCRTSTQTQGTGLEAQERALRDYCEARGATAPSIFSDFGISGAKSSRPALDALMEAVERGDVDTVIVYSFSRYARSTKHLLESLENFQARNVAFVSVTEAVDTSSAIGKALFTIISAIAELERELVRERVRTGLANARAKGRQIGRKKTRNAQLIQALAAQGMSARAIAKLARCSHVTVLRELETQRSTNQVM